MTTIAASVAVTAFAGIPLSNKGLAEKLGVSNVAYAALSESHATYLEKARKFYAALEQVSNGVADVNAFRAQVASVLNNPSNSAILDPIVQVLPADKQAEFKEMLKSVVSISVGSDWETQLKNSRDQYGDFLKSLVPAGQELTIDDIAEVVFELESKVAALSYNVLDLTSAQVQKLVKDAVAVNANAVAFEAFYDVERHDFVAVYEAIVADATITRAAALKAFIALEAAYKIANPSGGNNGGGVVGGGSETVVLPSSVSNLLDSLKAALEKATDAEKAAIIEKFVKDAQALINSLSVINASSYVTVVDGQAVLKLNDSSVLSVIAGISELSKKVKEVAPKAELTGLGLTFNLGAITQNAFVLNLSDAVVKAGASANLTGSKFIVDKFEVTVPFGGTFSSAISLTAKTSAATEAIVGALKSASSVYDFTLTVGGTATTTFSKPIVVSIPLGNLDGLDKELLSVAKIVNGKLEFHGGRVKGSSIIEPRDTFSSYVVVENKVSFTDIASVNAWAGREIEVIAAKGAIEGKSAGKFAPKDNVTRAEFAKMLVRGLDLDNGSATENFDDVKAGDWFAPYVAAAADLGIINGRSASKFDPNATITRAEMATMIARALKLTTGAKDVADQAAALKGFADAAKINPSLTAGVAFAASEGIVIGSNGKFLPNGKATRAEAAVIIYRAVNFE